MKYSIIFAIGSAALAVAAPVTVDINSRDTTVVTGGAGIGFEGSGRGGNVANGGDGGNSRKGDG
ncbi:hypothetical protein COCC4DRAFT_37389, partial [Bipolaris maydis ATCC 48331]